MAGEKGGMWGGEWRGVEWGERRRAAVGGEPGELLKVH